MTKFGMFDLHCDTLTEGDGDSINDPSRVLTLDKMPRDRSWVQLYAIFIPDEYRGQAAIDYFDEFAASFRRQTDKFAARVMRIERGSDIAAATEAGKVGAMLAIEGGAALAGDIRRVKAVHDAGVRCMTLVWNGENEIASGNDTKKGFTDFGRELIPEMERQGVTVDVSHLNDRGFDDLTAVAKKPFIATHSNARAVAAHPRNLRDDQIKEIIARGGLIGLNYCIAFICEDCVVKSLDDLWRHAEHILSLGGRDVLALGSDFDGARLPACLDSCEKAFDIADCFMRHGLSAAETEAIMYGNARRFFEKSI